MAMKTESTLNELAGYASSLQLGYLSSHLQEILHQAQIWVTSEASEEDQEAAVEELSSFFIFLFF